MKTLRDKLKKHAEKILWSIIATALIGWFANVGITCNKKEYRSGSETYQGYHIVSDDGRNQYVFDPETKVERDGRAPKYRIFGKPCLTDSLTIGKKYDFTIEKRSFPWSKEYIECIIPCRSEDSEDK